MLPDNAISRRLLILCDSGLPVESPGLPIHTIESARALSTRRGLRPTTTSKPQPIRKGLRRVRALHDPKRRRRGGPCLEAAAWSSGGGAPPRANARVCPDNGRMVEGHAHLRPPDRVLSGRSAALRMRGPAAQRSRDARDARSGGWCGGGWLRVWASIVAPAGRAPLRTSPWGDGPPTPLPKAAHQARVPLRGALVRRGPPCRAPTRPTPPHDRGEPHQTRPQPVPHIRARTECIEAGVRVTWYPKDSTHFTAWRRTRSCSRRSQASTP